MGLNLTWWVLSTPQVKLLTGSDRSSFQMSTCWPQVAKIFSDWWWSMYWNTLYKIKSRINIKINFKVCLFCFQVSIKLRIFALHVPIFENVTYTNFDSTWTIWDQMCLGERQAYYWASLFTLILLTSFYLPKYRVYGFLINSAFFWDSPLLDYFIQTTLE